MAKRGRSSRRTSTATTPAPAAAAPAAAPAAAVQPIKSALDELNDDITSISAEINGALKTAMTGVTAEARSFQKIIGQDLLKSLREVKKVTDDIESNEEKIAERSLKSKDVAKQMSKLQKEYEKTELKIRDAVKHEIIDKTQAKEIQKDLKKALDNQSVKLETQKKNAEIQEARNARNLKYHERLEKSFNYLAKIPILGGMINVGKIMDKVKKTAEEGAGKWKQFGAGLGEMFKQLSDPFTIMTTAITGAISLFTTLFKWALAFDQKVYDAAKSIGVSVGEAGRLQGKFQAIAASGMNLGLQAKDIVKTFSEMNDQLGFMVPSTASFAGSMTLIQKRIGASAGDMEALSTASAYTGKSIKSTYGILVGTAKVEAARNGFMMTNKQILGAIAATSKTVLMNFGGNVKELVKSIVQAKKLGTTLEDIQNKGKGLLDFESSIGKEFEFQALTGSKIDLQKARQFAQARDTVNLMKELNTQGLTFVEWNDLGQIEQDSYADLMSTSVEELNKMYNAQRQITALGAQEGQSLANRYGILMKTVEGRKKIAESLSKEEQSDLSRASANETWEATLERIKDLLGSILRGPVIEIVNTVAGWLNNTKLVHEFGMKVRTVFQYVADIVKGIPGFLEKIPGYLQKAIPYIKIIATAAAVFAAASIAASMGLGGPIAGAAGLAMGLYAYDKLTSLLDGGSAASVAGEGTASQPISPMNQAAQGAAASGAAAQGGGTTVVQNTSNLVVEGGVFTSMVTKNIMQDHRVTTDNAGNKGTDISQPSSPFYGAGVVHRK